MRMKLLEVFTPELNTYVKYKVLEPVDVDIFVQQHQNTSKEDYILAVLESVVFNLKSEITGRLKNLDKSQARNVLDNIFNGCVMLNPGLDVDTWLRISGTNTEDFHVNDAHRHLTNYKQQPSAKGRKRITPKTI